MVQEEEKQSKNPARGPQLGKRAPVDSEVLRRQQLKKEPQVSVVRKRGTGETAQWFRVKKKNMVGGNKNIYGDSRGTRDSGQRDEAALGY